MLDPALQAGCQWHMQFFLEFPSKNMYIIILMLAIASWVRGGICKLQIKWW